METTTTTVGERRPPDLLVLGRLREIVWHAREQAPQGGGTIPAVCRQLGRRFIGFEIEPEVAEMARQRLAVTQPLLGSDWLEQPLLPGDEETSLSAERGSEHELPLV